AHNEAAQFMEFSACVVEGDKADSGLRQPKSVKHSDKTNDCHAQGIQAERLGSQYPRQVHFEEITRRGSENRPLKEDCRVPRDPSHLCTKLLGFVRDSDLSRWCV